jgi:hypothetical protein
LLEVFKKTACCVVVKFPKVLKKTCKKWKTFPPRKHHFFSPKDEEPMDGFLPAIAIPHPIKK